MTDAYPLTPAFTLRPLSFTDAEAAAALIRNTFAGISPPLVPPPSALGETAATVAAQIEAGGGAMAEGPGAVPVGVILWGQRDGGLYLGRLAVAPGWRRAGVARALIAMGEGVAREAGLPRVHVGVRLVLEANRRLFAALGYCETHLHSHEGFANPTWVEMEKPLSWEPAGPATSA